EIRRRLTVEIPRRRGIELFQCFAARLYCPILDHFVRPFPSEYNGFAARIENWCNVLARVVIRQLAQQFSILSIQIQMGVTDSLRLQITNGDYDFRIAPRDRHKERKYSSDSQDSKGRAHQRRGRLIVLGCAAS